MKKERCVGIDLCPASSPAPGTARFVEEQARALFKLNVPWRWIPTIDSKKNPLWTEAEGLSPMVLPEQKMWKRASLSVGRAWANAGCHAGLATAYFVPWSPLPVVANFFDSNIYEHFGTWTRSGRIMNALLIRMLSDLAVFRARKLFVLSSYCANYMKAKFPHQAEKFLVIPPGITRPLDGVESARPKWAGSLKEPFLLYVGTFSENKNQRRLLEAYVAEQRLGTPLPMLVVVGPSPSEYSSAKIDPVLKKSPALDHIHLPGRLSDAELAWCYRKSLAYIQPSIAEGFGLPVIEAMSYGLPVACSNTTSLPETAGDAALLFDPFAISSIAAALRRISQDCALRAELIRKGCIRWAKFTWQSNAERVAREIELLLASRGRGER